MAVAPPRPKTVLTGPRELLAKDSPEFAASTLEELRFRWANVRDDERRFMAVLGEVLEARVYERWPSGEPYGDPDRLCRGELGVTLAEARDTVARVTRERVRKAAALARVERERAGRRNMADSAILTQRARANQAGVDRHTQGMLDWLARERAPLLEEVQQGKLSVDAAYRLATGKPKRITMLMEPQSIARAIRRHLNSEQLAALSRLLCEGHG